VALSAEGTLLNSCLDTRMEQEEGTRLFPDQWSSLKHANEHVPGTIRSLDACGKHRSLPIDAYAARTTPWMRMPPGSVPVCLPHLTQPGQRSAHVLEHQALDLLILQCAHGDCRGERAQAMEHARKTKLVSACSPRNMHAKHGGRACAGHGACTQNTVCEHVCSGCERMRKACTPHSGCVCSHSKCRLPFGTVRMPILHCSPEQTLGCLWTGTRKHTYRGTCTHTHIRRAATIEQALTVLRIAPAARPRHEVVSEEQRQHMLDVGVFVQDGLRASVGTATVHAGCWCFCAGWPARGQVDTA